jgi:hypothetical protein
MNGDRKKKWLKPAVFTCALLACLTAAAIFWFIRERPMANLNACISNLKSIEIAKAMVAKEQGLAKGDTVSTEMLSSVMNGKWPLRCPSGGEYSVNPLGSTATCSYPNHAIP